MGSPIPHAASWCFSLRRPCNWAARIADGRRCGHAVGRSVMEILPGVPPQDVGPAVAPPATASAASSPVPRLKMWGIRRSIAVTVGAAVLLVLALVLAALMYGHFPAIKRDRVVSTGTLFDLLKLIFAVVAGVGGFAGLAVAYRRQRILEHASELAHAADERAETTKLLAQAADERARLETERNGVRLFNERFTKAAEQLGSDKAAIRLAGVYAMAGLADDWPAGRQTCIDVLCAYLRMPYEPASEAPTGEPQAITAEHEAARQRVRDAKQEREVRHTVIAVIAAHLQDPADATTWCGHELDFTGAVFDGGGFMEAKFTGGVVSFGDAQFIGPHMLFDMAEFNGSEVFFIGARFTGSSVFFSDAQFTGGEVHFNGAKFTGGEVSFSGAQFTGSSVSFSDAQFTGSSVSFTDAQFTGGAVDLRKVASFKVPPRFDTWPEKPARLLFPAA